MDCNGCIHKRICEAICESEGTTGSCYLDNCKETIEDILGDDYDLDRMRELVEADRAGRVRGAAVPYRGPRFYGNWPE